MSTLTKDEIQRLSPQQQADVATVEARRAQKRERLLRQARQSRYFIFASGGGLALAYGAAVFSGAPFRLQMSIFVIAMAILIQAVGIHRRLDALMELLDEDHDA